METKKEKANSPMPPSISILRTTLASLAIPISVAIAPMAQIAADGNTSAVKAKQACQMKNP
ncbi:MAG: hypothetical protein DHS20C12_06720 [Pseudohongiella sp.]|nr:MAG: hypothetical protein DHS20C12_06720 [Pseudohongiella sp.]